MKKNKKKNNFFKKLKEKFKGFTLVELLAVIVILAIIMVVAIPSVLETLSTAKLKTFFEYADKISTKTVEKYMSDKDLSGLKVPNDEYSMIIYSISDDLGLSSTGDFHGFAAIWHGPVDGERKEIKIYVIWNEDYVLFFNDYDGIPTSANDVTYIEDLPAYFDTVYDGATSRSVYADTSSVISTLNAYGINISLDDLNNASTQDAVDFLNSFDKNFDAHLMYECVAYNVNSLK